MTVLLTLLALQDADAILSDLAADDVDIREAATERLRAMPPATAAPVIARALESGDVEVRARARHVWLGHQRDLTRRAPQDPAATHSPFGTATATVRVIGRRSPAPPPVWRRVIGVEDRR